MRTIVVGYDGGESAKRALERAAELASPFDAGVVVHVEPLLPAEVTPGDPVLLSHGLTAPVAPPGDDQTLAEEREADLIVVGTREPGFVERLLTGSTSGAVARQSGRDVLIVH